MHFSGGDMPSAEPLVAERVGILSAAYKSPRAAYATLNTGLNITGDISVKVQGLCS
jgi:hypothetical protein